MKLKVVFVFVFVFIFNAQPSVAWAANFSDVPDTHKNAYAIQTLKDAQIISGYGDGTFQPEKSISRAEAVAIILKAVGITSTKTAAKLPFSDVSDTEWYFPMIQKGVALGKLKGYGDKTFRPNNPVTLPEALALAVSFFNINILKVKVDSLIYEGLNREEWYAKYAQYAKDKNLIEPDSNGIVDAITPLTRGQLAELIYRMRTSKQTDAAFDITSGWIITEHPDNFWKFRHPADWEVFKGSANSVLWRPSGSKIFFTRLWPNSARLSISLVENPENLSANQFFENLKDAYKKEFKQTAPKAAPIFEQLTLSGRNALKITLPQERVLDIAIDVPAGFLMLFGDYGSAPIAEFFKKQLDLVMMSYQFIEKPIEPPKPVIPLEERMETLRENILVAGKWTDVADLFPDKKLIHTDAIGVGTGPVDYYYSAEANTTIKLERNSNTILNIKDGETEAF